MAMEAPARRAWGETGVTLIEIIVAVAVIAVGLIGVVAGFLHAVGGLETGRQQTTAVFLAEQRMEQLKAGALTDFRHITAARYASEGYGGIVSEGQVMPGYRRTVTVIDTPGGLADTKLVDVDVFYRPVVGFGVLASERSVRLSALVTARR